MDKDQVERYWFWGSPLLCFGEHSLDFLQDIPGKKAFIVTDDFIKKNLLPNVTKKLKKFDKDYEVFSEVMPDPKEEMVLRGVEACKEYDPDLILGVGGGSSIDTAKAIWVLYERPDLNLDDIHPFVEMGLGNKAKMVALPTTSGTGAETTWAVIITRIREDGTEIKLELANRDVVPNYAILDPVFTMKMPPNLTAATAFDALSHVYEGLISEFRNDFSEGMGIKSVDLIRNYLPVVYEDGDNVEAREAIHNAAAMAGLCFGNSQVIMGHGLGHALGAVFHKPHGLCVGVFCPYILQFQLNGPNKEVVENLLGKTAKMLGIAEWSDENGAAASKVINDIKTLQEKVDFPKTLADLDISKEEFEGKIDQVVELALESSSSEFSIRPATAKEYEKILRDAYEGRDINW